MFFLTIEDTFASAHQLRNYKGKCENLHGHNWKVVLKVKGNFLNESDLVIDFNDLKKILKTILQDLDHQNLNKISPFDKKNPSSENISLYIFERAEELLAKIDPKVMVDSVTVWESERSRCTYRKENN